MDWREGLYYSFWRTASKIASRRSSSSAMSLHPKGEYISDQIRRTKSHYELANLTKVSLLCDVRMFVDVGANLGNHSNFFEQKGATGVAFEPSKLNFQLLERNAPSFSCHNVALSREPGEAFLRTYPDSMGNSRLLRSPPPSPRGGANAPWKFEKVRVSTLDSYDIRDVSLLKIDAEGSELNILLGAERTIIQSSPLIWIELHEDANLVASGSTYQRRDILDLLKKSGYCFFLNLDATNFLFSKIRRVLWKPVALF